MGDTLLINEQVIRYYEWAITSQQFLRDAKKYVQACDSCQRMGQPNRLDEIPLQPYLVVERFDRWALDFVGPINPPSKKKVYMLVCNDYMTKLDGGCAFGESQ